MEKSTIIQIIKLVVSIVICQLAGFLGSLFTTPAIPVWYAALQKPWFTPPNWVFAPVWTTLFALMGISAFLVWREGLGEKGVSIALGVFVVQLVLNVCWSVIFFGLKSPGLAFVEIVILWALILLTIVMFYGISRVAASLLIPYVVWVSFAAVLNFAVWRLNA